MEATRQQKIERQIQKDLSDIFLIQAKQLHGVLVSVSEVRISPDLGIAKVYLSIFPSERGAEIVEAVKINAKSIRFELGQKVRNQLRKVPELIFFLDETIDYLENIDNLLKK